MTSGPADEEMTAAERWKDLSWEGLAKLPDRERDEAFVARLSSLAKLPEKQRKIELGTMALITAELPKDAAVAVTGSRLRAWLRMNPHQAEVVAASYEIAMAELPGYVAWERITMVQQAVKRLSPEEQRKLHLLFPREVAEAPAATVSPSPKEKQLPADKPRKRTWWPFSHR